MEDLNSNPERQGTQLKPIDQRYRIKIHEEIADRAMVQQPSKRHSSEQIITKLREAEVHIIQGMTIPLL